MERYISFLGLLTMLFLAWLLSTNKRQMNVRLILSGLALQMILAVAILKTDIGNKVFDKARLVIMQIVGFSDAGAKFLFGESLVDNHHFAFSVLPVVIFVSTLTAVLFHLGVLQFIVKMMAWVMVRVMDVSGSESLATSANVFVGMTEAPLVIRPYLATMTRSELMAMMIGGMATIAGSVMAAYANMGADAGHLLAASLMSAPAALVIAKIILPETEESPTKGHVTIKVPKEDVNILDAACRGASVGLRLALNVGAMLIAFVALVAMANGILAFLPEWQEAPVTIERLLGLVLAPLAWVMGVEWADTQLVGMLLGKKIILNEFIAYMDLVAIKDQISARSFTIATYALCSFANFGSIAIMIGGIGGMEPSRRKDLARFSLRALAGGALAGFMTASVAGMLIDV